jgi:hypothetical protein
MMHGTLHGRLILNHINRKTRAFSERAELVIDRFSADSVQGEEGRLTGSLGAHVLLRRRFAIRIQKKIKNVEKRTSIHSMAVFSSSTMTASMLRPRITDTAVSYLR